MRRRRQRRAGPSGLLAAREAQEEVQGVVLRRRCRPHCTAGAGNWSVDRLPWLRWARRRSRTAGQLARVVNAAALRRGWSALLLLLHRGYARRTRHRRLSSRELLLLLRCCLPIQLPFSLL